MKTNDKVIGKKAGFTIVELLTVMAVIAILIGLLVPALNQVHDKASDLQQRVQFHAIDVGLELYKSEYGEYPSSIDNVDRLDPDGSGAMPAYSGANKLAEALVGWDLLGFHPDSEFTANGYNLDIINTRVPVYNPAGLNPIVADGGEKNREERSDLFLELEKANAFRLEDVYENAAFTGSGLDRTNFVLCDSYTKRRAASGEKTGTPILYFRAKTQYTIQETAILDSSGVPTSVDLDDDVYDYRHNQNIMDLGFVDDNTVPHPLADGLPSLLYDYAEFDEILVNEQVESIQVPFRAQSYILMSAGKDGLFGNSDDIYNFEKER